MTEETNKVPNEYGIIDPQYDKCNHRIKSNSVQVPSESQICLSPLKKKEVFAYAVWTPQAGLR